MPTSPARTKGSRRKASGGHTEAIGRTSQGGSPLLGTCPALGRQPLCGRVFSCGHRAGLVPVTSQGHQEGWTLGVHGAWNLQVRMSSVTSQLPAKAEPNCATCYSNFCGVCFRPGTSLPLSSPAPHTPLSI